MKLIAPYTPHPYAPYTPHPYDAAKKHSEGDPDPHDKRRLPKRFYL